MLDAAIDRALDQRARVHGVVAVVAERIAHRIRHDDRRGEMDDGFDTVFTNEPCHERLIAGLADDERYVLGKRPGKAGRQIVEHHDALAGIGKLVHHVAADVAGSAGDQDRHMSGIHCSSWLPPTTI